MNSKNTTYILIVAFIVVWGFIGLQIYRQVEPSGALKAVSDNNNYNKSDKIELEIFELALSYKDPFLGKLDQANIAGVKKSSVQQKVKTEQGNISKNNTKKKLRFTGLIMNENNGNSVGVLFIDNEEFLISKGMLIGDLEVVRINEEFVQLENNFETLKVEKE